MFFEKKDNNKEQETIALCDAQVGMDYEIVAIPGVSLAKKLAVMGIFVGTIIRVVDKLCSSKSIVIANGLDRLALGCGMSEKILLKKIK